MLRPLREAGPALLVPLAWLVVALADRGLLSARSIFIAHLVMAAFIVFFLVTGWSAMETGALAGWRVVVATGLVVTLAGIGGFLWPAVSTPLWTTSLLGWMLLPIPGFGYTAWLLDDGAWVYAASAVVTALGVAVWLAALAGGGETLTLAGLALVGLGHTVGIVDAVVRF
jgi:hypothetical protein